MFNVNVNFRHKIHSESTTTHDFETSIILYHTLYTLSVFKFRLTEICQVIALYGSTIATYTTTKAPDAFFKESQFQNPSFIVLEDTFSKTDPSFATAYESLTLKIIAIITYILKVPVGCTLLFLVIHFEQFGGDPQKRSIFNQIFAYMAAIKIIGVLLIQNLFTIRVFFGCMPDVLGTVIWFSMIFENVIVLLLLMVASTYKMLRLYFFNRMACLNDDFFSIFILLVTITISMIFMTIEYMMGENVRHPLYQIVTCGKGEIDFEQK